MKTPREILLERHRAVAPKLDAMRREIVAELNNEETKERSFQSLLSGFVSLFLCCSKKFWLELIFPNRRIWTGLAAIWILLFIFNFSQRDKTELTVKNVSPSPEMILAFQQQEKLLAELIDENEPRAVEPKKFLPQPRSERQVEILIT